MTKPVIFRMKLIPPLPMPMNVCQRANIEHGINMVSQIAYTVPIENSITIQTRSIMGTEIPHVKYTPANEMPTYSFSTTRESIDAATKAFQKVKDLTVEAFHGGKCSLPSGEQY